METSMRRLMWDMHALICEQTARRLHCRFQIPDRMSRFKLRPLEAWATGRMSRSSPSASSSIDEDQAPTCTPGLSRDMAPRRSQRVISTAPLPRFSTTGIGEELQLATLSRSRPIFPPLTDSAPAQGHGEASRPSTLSVGAGKFER